MKQNHKQAKFCHSRPRYREARWERAVKVYTINQESRYLLVQGIPSVGVSKELVELFALYGEVDEYRILDEYPSEEFTDTYWVKFKKIQSARFAKKKLDMRSFFGGILHVAYAPEYETVSDTREKLRARQYQVAKKCKEYFPEPNVQPEKEVESFSKERDNQIQTVSEPDTPCRSLINPAVSSEQILIDSQACPLITTSTNQPGTPHFPLLPTPPANLPFYCYPPPPPPPPSEYPRIATKHATLPVQLQNISRSEMEGNEPDRSNIKASTKEVHSQLNMTESPVDSRLTNSSSSERFKRPIQNSEKKIVWLQQPSASSSSTVTVSASPGAWDPYAEQRKLNKSLTGDKNLDNVAERIRERLRNSSGTSSEISVEERKKPRKRI